MKDKGLFALVCAIDELTTERLPDGRTYVHERKEERERFLTADSKKLFARSLRFMCFSNRRWDELKKVEMEALVAVYKAQTDLMKSEEILHKQITEWRKTRGDKSNVELVREDVRQSQRAVIAEYEKLMVVHYNMNVEHVR